MLLLSDTSPKVSYFILVLLSQFHAGPPRNTLLEMVNDSSKVGFVSVQSFFEKFLQGDNLPPEVVSREGQEVVKKISDPGITERVHMLPILASTLPFASTLDSS